MAEPESTRADRLSAARDRLVGLLAAEVDGTKAAALSREVRALESELADVAPSEKVRTVDDLARRRADRIANAPVADKAPVRKRSSRAGGDRPS